MGKEIRTCQTGINNATPKPDGLPFFLLKDNKEREHVIVHCITILIVDWWWWWRRNGQYKEEQEHDESHDDDAKYVATFQEVRDGGDL